MGDTQQMISVIVPVYNAALYLHQCLDSILQQSYEALEIILVDDGSKDDSGRICDEYAQKDSRIRVIHQENGGAAAAKNAGLRIATGTYLSFVDSDDFLEPGAYRYMTGLLEENSADAVQCAFRRVYRDRQEECVIGSGKITLDTEAALVRFAEDWTSALLWNKLYKRSLFENIYFPIGHVIDDEFFTYRGIMNAKKIIYTDRIIYNYRMRRSSVMHSPELSQRRLMDSLIYIKERRENIISRFPKLRRIFNSDYLDALIYSVNRQGIDAQSIAVIKLALKEYFESPDMTLPGIRSWPRHLFMRFASEQQILRICKVSLEEENRDQLFA